MGLRRKQNKTYWFTVEGQSEKLYLEWLEKALNQYQSFVHVIFNITVQQNPMRYVKTISSMTTPEVIHMCDVEGSSAEDLKKFESTLWQMKQAKRTKGIQYSLAYSNLDFELWMVLHKTDANSSVSNKQQYLRMLNRAYGTSFDSLDEYKEKSNFSSILSRLAITDVIAACRRAERIMAIRKNNSVLSQNFGYTYYLDNPSTSVHCCI